MTTPMQLRYNADGIGFAELFAEPGLIDLLPGVMPDELNEGDEWEDEEFGA